MSFDDLAFYGSQLMALMLAVASVLALKQNDWRFFFILMALASLISSDGFDDYRRRQTEGEQDGPNT